MNKNIFEVWKPVVGFEEFYAVSSLGRVKSIERTVVCSNGIQRRYREKLLKPAKNGNNYLHVELHKNGKAKTFGVHRLVALAFIPNPCPEKYDIVNHKDDNPNDHTNNTVENLEWCDYDYNNNYGHHNERVAKANTNGKRSKTVYQYTKSYELVKEWVSINEVHRQMGWNKGHISDCCNGKRKSANGFIWSYTPLV